jgi:hypothetical protein
MGCIILAQVRCRNHKPMFYEKKTTEIFPKLLHQTYYLIRPGFFAKKDFHPPLPAAAASGELV